MPQDETTQSETTHSPPRTHGQAQAGLLSHLIYFVRGYQLCENWHGTSMVDQLFGYGHRQALEDARKALIARDATTADESDA